MGTQAIHTAAATDLPATILCVRQRNAIDGSVIINRHRDAAAALQKVSFGTGGMGKAGAYFYTGVAAEQDSLFACFVGICLGRIGKRRAAGDNWPGGRLFSAAK